MSPQAWGGMLYTMDAGLGNITQELKAQRMWAQTLMVVTVRATATASSLLLDLFRTL